MNYERLQYRNAKGFTLIELLVVVVLIGIMTAIVIAVPRDRGSLIIDREVRNVVQDIRKARDLGLRGEVFGGGAIEFCPNDGEFSNTEFINYGIHFKKDEDSYTIFANCKSTMNSQEKMQPLLEIPLREGITIASVAFDPPPASPQALQWQGARITFTPPDPITKITNDSDNGNVVPRVTVTLELRRGAVWTRNITITDRGLIEVE